MKIAIEQAPNAYVVELLKDNGKLDTVLCTREFYEDAISDARWYKDNEYPNAKLQTVNFDRTFRNLELLRDQYELTENEQKIINEAHCITQEVQQRINN